jgi:murein DD-endopeptidase MepM/ murein hydrolase activator NlpD
MVKKLLKTSLLVLLVLPLIFTSKALAEKSTLHFYFGDNEGGSESTPGVFKVPLKRGLTYWGLTYPDHSAYSVDINRGNGYDDYGDSVYASADGRVDYILASHGQVQINHALGYQTLYVHMSKIFVGVGDSVKQCQKIGEIGDVGAPGQSHLHYNQARNGIRIKVTFDKIPYPVSVFNPTSYLVGPKIKGDCQ